MKEKRKSVYVARLDKLESNAEPVLAHPSVDASVGVKQPLSVQDWLYDEGEDESKAVYVAKLKELEALGEPVLARAREAGARPGASAALMSTANRLIQIASANDAKHAHIPQEDKEKASLESLPSCQPLSVGSLLFLWMHP